MYIDKQSRMMLKATENQSFFGVHIGGLDKEVRDKILAFEKSIDEYQKYLRGILGIAMTGAVDADPNTLEVPECLGIAAAPSVEPPKKKGIAQRLSSKSLSKLSDNE